MNFSPFRAALTVRTMSSRSNLFDAASRAADDSLVHTALATSFAEDRGFENFHCSSPLGLVLLIQGMPLMSHWWYAFTKMVIPKTGLVQQVVELPKLGVKRGQGMSGMGR